jgi:hypothetical protein
VIEIVKGKDHLLNQGFGVPVFKDFDTRVDFEMDHIIYSGEWQLCLKVDDFDSTTRVALSWIDVHNILGKLVNNLNLMVVSEIEARSSFDKIEIFEVLDIKGQFLRIIIKSEKSFIINEEGHDLIFALSLNKSATIVPCSGGCPPGNISFCDADHESFCLFDGSETNCLAKKCPEGMYGEGCEFMFQTPEIVKTCTVENGFGVLSEDEEQCLVTECLEGFYIYNSTKCSCPLGATRWCDLTNRLSICPSNDRYFCEPENIFANHFDLLMPQDNMGLAKTICPLHFLGFFFIFIFIIFF